MAELCMKVMRCCAEWTVRETDSPEDKRVKRLYGPVCVIYIVVSSVFVIRAMQVGAYFYACCMGWNALTSMWFLGAGFMGFSGKVIADRTLVATALGTLALDWYTAARGLSRAFNFIVLLLDAALVFEREFVTRLILACTLAYLCFERLESWRRWGLYEVAGWGESSQLSSMCDCAEPPCAQSFNNSSNILVGMLIVLLTDFYLTRGFASGLRHQLRRVRSAVDVAADVASALARYDVDSADRAIREDTELPEELRESYEQLLSNLRTYKAYLPHSCLIIASPQEKELGSDFGDDLLSSCGGTPCSSWVSTATPTPSKEEKDVLAQSKVSSASSPVEMTRVRRHSSFLSVGPNKAHATKKRATLVCLNRIGYSTMAEEFARASHEMWLAADVEQWCDAVGAQRGVVDSIGGDRRFATFNARQGCGQHAAAAVAVLFSWAEGRRMQAHPDTAQFDALQTTGCIVSGLVTCGDFGSSSALRYMVLGRTASSLYPLERVAALWRVAVLVDGDGFESVRYTWDGILLGAVVLAKRSKNAPVRLYSVLSTRGEGASQCASISEEWMYAMASLVPSHYAEQNEEREKAVREHFQGGIAIDVSDGTELLPLTPRGSAKEPVMLRVFDVGIKNFKGGRGSMRRHYSQPVSSSPRNQPLRLPDAGAHSRDKRSVPHWQRFDSPLDTALTAVSEDGSEP
eukprot:Hpha_TRINITY_DN16666_c1_g1::TRINITY_DN16666_c1_g1_i1::g.178516::m.178516